MNESTNSWHVLEFGSALLLKPNVEHMKRLTMASGTRALRIQWKLVASALLLAGPVPAFSQPRITGITLSGLPQTASDTYHPYATNSLEPNITFSASTGADVKFAVSASGTPPLYYQWQFHQADLPGQTNSTLILTNLQTAHAGDYLVRVTNAAGLDSRIATLQVDATFTKITSGPVVTSRGLSIGGTWGDYNGDGFMDLFVFNGGTGMPFHPFLFRNNQDGTFTSITSGPPLSAVFESYSASWGDFDNDGYLDLFISSPTLNLLFHNNGDGTFTQLFDSPVVRMSNVGTWVDYNNDGLLDLFLSGYDRTGGTNAYSFIFRNNGDGSFSPVTNAITTEPGSFLGGTWADYDHDGHPDLLLLSAVPPYPNRLYHNNGDGTFTRVTSGDLANDIAGFSNGVAWGDYDNDGLLDAFVANWEFKGNVLYHNDGNGSFRRVLAEPFLSDAGLCASCAWGDYDNDGFLDLFVTSGAPPNNVPGFFNFLYHNNGDGTFTKVTLGSPVNEYSTSFGCSWVDYNNDGFLDLYASLQDERGAYLYRNNGNSNAWLRINLTGTASNRAAIGAEVQVNAVYGGVSRWQLRQITGGGGFCGHNELQVHFGLGDATNVDVVRIEWPSGIVQTLTNVAPKQILNVVEHQQSAKRPPLFTNVAHTPEGLLNLTVNGDTNRLYLLEASTNLVKWTWLQMLTNTAGDIQFTDSNATNSSKRFYRITIP